MDQFLGEHILVAANLAAETMDDEEVFEYIKSRIEQILGNSVSLSKDTAIYHDLWLAGDDASDLLHEIHKRFGTDFSGMHFPDYIPEEGHEAFTENLFRLLGFRKKAKWRKLTLGHLINVVRKGFWFHPPTQIS